MKKCPFCGADILDTARFCLHCMNSLVEKEQILLHKKKKPQWIILILVAIVVSLATVLILFGNQTAPDSATPSDESSHIFPPSETKTEDVDTPPVTEPIHIHSFSEMNATAEYQKEPATCTSLAFYYYSCICGEKGTEAFPDGTVSDHTVVTDSGFPASCVKTGLTDGAHCAVCNTVLSIQTTIPVVNHTFDNAQDEQCNACNFIRVLNCKHEKTIQLPAVPPTCTAGGLTEGKKCALCEEILIAQSLLSPSGHTNVSDPGVDSTCTSEGKTEGKYCSVCNAVLVAQLTIPARGHTIVVERAVDSTCTSEGKTEGKYCSVCNAVLVTQLTTPAKGHIIVVDKAIPATCTTPGKTEGKHCSLCQTVLTTQQNVSATGHTFNSTNPYAPCSICGTIPPHTHSFTVQNTANDYLKSVATCLDPAIFYYSCACGEKGSETFSCGETGDHTYITEAGYPATCASTGLTDKKYCSVCQFTPMPHMTIEVLGHTYRLGGSNCLTCGETATVTVQPNQQFPLVLSNTYQINSCTYTIRPLSQNTNEISFEFNFTNVSSETVYTCPSGRLFLPSKGYWDGTCTHLIYSSPQPNESGRFGLRFTASAETTYTLQLY